MFPWEHEMVEKGDSVKIMSSKPVLSVNDGIEKHYLPPSLCAYISPNSELPLPKQTHSINIIN